MYYPSYVNIPEDVYRKSLDVASSYYLLQRRKQEINEQEPRATVNNWQIDAIESAWNALVDDTERAFIAKNLFDGIQMRYINLPMSHSSMKRVRKRFLCQLAENLGLW